MPSPIPRDVKKLSDSPSQSSEHGKWIKLLTAIKSAKSNDMFEDPELSAVMFAEIVHRAAQRTRTAVERGAMADFSNVLLKIQQQDNTQGALESLLEEARFYGLTAIRLYRQIQVQGDSMLVSIDCAGHDEQVSNRLRIGHIVKFRSKSPTTTHDTFWCVERRQPVAFRIDEEAPDVLQEVVLAGGLGVISLKTNQCENALVRHESRAWVDFPLEVCGKVVGKLSCDIAAGELDFVGARELLRLSDLLRMLAPYLHFLCGCQLDQPLQELALEVNTISSVGELFDFCVRRLPAKIHAKYASIFTVSTDSAGTEQLILRRTSFPPSKMLEETRFGTYRMEENALTPWIARSGISVFLPDMDDVQLRQRKMECYDPELRWINKVPDSENHGDFLGVPIRQSAKTIGVLRFTQRQNGNAPGHFAPHDQILIEQVARHLIAPKLLGLTQAEANLRLSRHLDVLRSFWRASRGSDTFKTFLPQIESVLQAFCDSVTVGKAILYFDRNAELWQSSGSLSDGDPAIRKGLANFALSRKGCVFINHLDKFRKDGRKPVAERAVCGLGVRVVAMGNLFGCIVVLSEHFDLSVETYGPILEQLASELDELIVRRRIVRRLTPLLDPSADARISIRKQALRLLAENPGVITSESVDELWEMLKPISCSRSAAIPVSEVARTIGKIARVRLTHKAKGLGIALPLALRLTAAILNLFRHYEACPVSRVHIEGQDGWLQASITPIPQIEERNAREAMQLLGRCKTDDGRHGDLHVDSGVCATLRIPIGQGLI